MIAYTQEDYIRLFEIWGEFPGKEAINYLNCLCERMSAKKAFRKCFGFGVNHTYWKFIFKRPLEEMPLLIAHGCKWIYEVAEWRLEIGK